MQRIWLAVRAFFLILCKREVAERLAKALAAGNGPSEAARPEVVKTEPRPASKPVAAPKPARSEAVTLLATLQREARFVDFIQEPLDSYSDAQVGAAVRDVHRDCRKVLDRLFAVRPILGQEDGSEVEVPAAFDAGRFHLTGNVVGEPPFRGRLAHHGWEAAACQIPSWSGTAAAANVVAPVEVEL